MPEKTPTFGSGLAGAENLTATRSGMISRPVSRFQTALQVPNSEKPEFNPFQQTATQQLKLKETEEEPKQFELTTEFTE
jgi:hypothetical protein